MRRLTILCLLTLSANLFGQRVTMRVTTLTLTKEAKGWRAAFPAGNPGKYNLQTGDLITRIAETDASGAGPLLMLAEFNAAFDRAIPMSFTRGGTHLRSVIWRGDGAAPSAHASTPIPAVSRSAKAPGFSLPNLAGQKVQLAQFRGKWLLINFWATWCAPCKEESVILNRLAKRFPDKLTILAVDVGDQPDKIAAFSQHNPPAYTILDGGSLQSTVSLRYGVGHPGGGGSVPLNVLVAPEGSIAYVEGGFEAPSPLEGEIASFVEKVK